MVRISRSVDVQAPPQRVWAALVDWARHGEWVPLTSVRLLTPSDAEGARFVARTALPGWLGRIGFDDVMEVLHLSPPERDRPGYCEVVKQGRVLLGRAWFEVRALFDGVASPDGVPARPASRVTWTEDIELAPPRLTRPLAPLISSISGLGLQRALAAMARDVEGGPPGKGGGG
jgi:hypothetical protein